MAIPTGSHILLMRLLRKGRYGLFLFMLKKMAKRLYSNKISFGLRRDLRKSFQASRAKIPVHIEKINAEHASAMLCMDMDLPSASLWERFRRIRLLNQQLETCYVGLTVSGEPCYMQWVSHASENEKISAFFGNGFQQLKDDEVLLEGAYVPEAFRGYWIMPYAMSMVAEKGFDKNTRFAITFVDADNIPSLKGCIRSGFFPYLVREMRWRCFKSRTTFRPLEDSDGFPVKYEA